MTARHARLDTRMLTRHTLIRVAQHQADKLRKFPNDAVRDKELIAWLRANHVAKTARALAARRFKLAIDKMIADGQSDRFIAQKMGLSRSTVVRYRKLNLLPDMPKDLDPNATSRWVEQDKATFEDTELHLMTVIDAYDDNDVCLTTEGIIAYAAEEETRYRSTRLSYAIESYMLHLGLREQDEMASLSGYYRLSWLLDMYLLWRQHYVFSMTTTFANPTLEDQSDMEFRRLRDQHQLWSNAIGILLDEIDTVIEHETNRLGAGPEGRDALRESIARLFLIDQTSQHFPFPQLDDQSANLDHLRDALMRADENLKNETHENTDETEDDETRAMEPASSRMVPPVEEQNANVSDQTMREVMHELARTPVTRHESH